MKTNAVFKAVTLNWLRSRSGLFFSFVFPVLLLLLLGSLSAGSSSGFLSQGPGFYLPGLVAAFIMTNGVIGLTNVASELKRSGVLRRLASTPLTRLDWILGNMLSQVVLGGSLAAVMLLLGFAVYGVPIPLSPFLIPLVIAGSLMFSGLGMVLAGIVSDPETASGLGNGVAFPMMLLAGTFWTLESMPGYLQALSKVLPLTYLTDGLRQAAASDLSGATVDLAVVLVFTAAFILLGSAFTRWTAR